MTCLIFGHDWRYMEGARLCQTCEAYEFIAVGADEAARINLEKEVS